VPERPVAARWTAMTSAVTCVSENSRRPSPVVTSVTVTAPVTVSTDNSLSKVVTDDKLIVHLPLVVALFLKENSLSTSYGHFT